MRIFIRVNASNYDQCVSTGLNTFVLIWNEIWTIIQFAKNHKWKLKAIILFNFLKIVIFKKYAVSGACFQSLSLKILADVIKIFPCAGQSIHSLDIGIDLHWGRAKEAKWWNVRGESHQKTCDLYIGSQFWDEITKGWDLCYDITMHISQFFFMTVLQQMPVDIWICFSFSGSKPLIFWAYTKAWIIVFNVYSYALLKCCPWIWDQNLEFQLDCFL